MKLKDIMVDKKTAWIQFPQLKGFQVQICYLARAQLNAITKRCTQLQFNRGGSPTQKLNTEKFVQQFTKKTVVNWRGFTGAHAAQLVLVNIDQSQKQKLIPYDSQAAIALVSGSNKFDSWLNEVAFDLSRFHGTGEVEAVEKTIASTK